MRHLKEHFWKKNRGLQRSVNDLGREVLLSPNFNKSRYFTQHGDVSVRRHSLDVARTSLDISQKLEKLGIHSSKRDLVRGALLHDYFLYDWHDKNRPGFKPWHGFYHPGVALQNANKEYHLSPREKDIIKKHMWPLTIVPPICREAWIVSTADKVCSLRETLRGKHH